MSKHALIIFCLFVLTNSMAQNGPTLPCEDCEEFTHRVFPTTGFWGNPEQSGTGINIQIQNRILMGNYYGFDANGKSLWYAFTGQLQPSKQPGVMWEFDADLQQSQNGTCINCTYQASSDTPPTKQIHISFNHLTHASFNIDKGPIQNIVHENFGVDEIAPFPDLTTMKIPDLKGYWVFGYRYDTINWSPGDPFLYFIGGLMPPTIVYINPVESISNNDGTSRFSFRVDLLAPAPTYKVYFGEIECHTELNQEKILTDPICGFSTNFFPFDDIKFRMSLAAFGESRLFGESELGHVFKGFRFDYCDFNADNPDFVCEGFVDWVFKNGFE